MDYGPGAIAGVEDDRGGQTTVWVDNTVANDTHHIG